MGFESVLAAYDWQKVGDTIYNATPADVERALGASVIREQELAALLSPAAEAFMEPMAARAHQVTLRRFGRTIKVYAPVYLSNTCSNACAYCGFSAKNKIHRVNLTPAEIEQEMKAIAETGVQHLLLVTGEAPNVFSVADIENAARIAGKYFSSVSIEVFPMSEADYSLLNQAGVDGLTIYQETYNRDVYDTVHLAGRKKDFDWRLGTPERGAAAGFRTVGIGTLMGLADFRVEQFFTALHARYLMKTFWKTHVTVSFPRIRFAPGNYVPEMLVSDTNLVQTLLCQRLFSDDVGIVVSTREPAHLRDNLLPLGVTQMSAGSKTEPGGYTIGEHDGKQFSIEDERSVAEFCAALKQKGYDPVLKDWDRSFLDAARS